MSFIICISERIFSTWKLNTHLPCYWRTSLRVLEDLWLSLRLSGTAQQLLVQVLRAPVLAWSLPIITQWASLVLSHLLATPTLLASVAPLNNMQCTIPSTDIVPLCISPDHLAWFWACKSQASAARPSPGTVSVKISWAHQDKIRIYFPCICFCRVLDY